MREDFLHYIWRFKQFDFLNLISTDGLPIHIIQLGNYNTDSGPDFLNAKIKIGDQEWAGSVEMHLKSSDWIKHKHSDNKDYNNVILHVVWQEDKQIYNAANTLIPCLELSKITDLKLQDKYLNLLSSQLWIPCQDNISQVPQIKIKTWIERLMIDRLEEKVGELKEQLTLLENNWEQLLFILIAKNLGLTQNADPLESLAKTIPVDILFKHSDKLFDLESLLFGQSGFLQDALRDEYPKNLKSEYNFLSKKYSLISAKYPNWKLLRMRPSNFPTIRISQLAAIYHVNNVMFDKVREGSITEIRNVFKNITASEYWDSHYLFDKASEKNSKKRLGKNRINIILINAVAPILFLYGKVRGNYKFIDKSLELLSALPAEKNFILREWNSLGLESKSAFDSQSLIHLKTRYCSKQRCLQCAIGHHIMNK